MKWWNEVKAAITPILSQTKWLSVEKAEPSWKLATRVRVTDRRLLILQFTNIKWSSQSSQLQVAGCKDLHLACRRNVRNIFFKLRFGFGSVFEKLTMSLVQNEFWFCSVLKNVVRFRLWYYGYFLITILYSCNSRLLNFIQQNLISDGITNLVHAELPSEFRLSLDPAIAQSKLWSQLTAERLLRTKFGLNNRRVQTQKKHFIFWHIFNFSPNLEPSISLSEIPRKLEGHSVERMYLRQRCFDGSLPQWMKPW